MKMNGPTKTALLLTFGGLLIGGVVVAVNLFADEDVEFDQYDLILHDGSHIGSEVLVDLNNIYPYLKHDGVLITHDTRHHSLGDGMMGAVEEFAKDKDLEMCTLPYGYGLTFFRNKANIDNKVNLTWRKK